MESLDIAIHKKFHWAQETSFDQILIHKREIRSAKGLHETSKITSFEMKLDNNSLFDQISVSYGHGSGSKDNPFSISKEGFAVWAQSSMFDADRLRIDRHNTFGSVDFFQNNKILSFVICHEGDGMRSMLMLCAYNTNFNCLSALILSHDVLANKPGDSWSNLSAHILSHAPSIAALPLSFLPAMIDFLRLSAWYTTVLIARDLDAVEHAIGMRSVVSRLVAAGDPSALAADAADYDTTKMSLLAAGRRQGLLALKHAALDNYIGVVQEVVDAAQEGFVHTGRAIAYVKRQLSIQHAEAEAQVSRLSLLRALLHGRIVQQDAQLGHRLSRGARRDSAAMKTIALLTLIYLPATFVSAVFSTSVFDFQNWGTAGKDGAGGKKGEGASGVVASRGLWVYATTCAVATSATLVFWWVVSMREHKRVAQEEKGEEKKKQEEPENGRGESVSIDGVPRGNGNDAASAPWDRSRRLFAGLVDKDSASREKGDEKV